MDIRHEMVFKRLHAYKFYRHLQLNPQHTIPTLTDGDYVVWDSHAIIAYLVNKYAKDDSFYPKDPQKRGTVDNRLHYNNSVFFNSHKTLVVIMEQ